MENTNAYPPIFLTNVKVNRLRHLYNREIPISFSEKKHLILTGKNGSGKTTILTEIKNHILAKTLNWVPGSPQASEAATQYNNMINNAISNLRQNNNFGSDGMLLENIYESVNGPYSDYYKRQGQSGKSMGEFLSNYLYDSLKRAETNFMNQDSMQLAYQNGGFVNSYFDAKRSTSVGSPNGIVPLKYRYNYSITTNINSTFLQYIVNLKAEQSFANDENDFQTRDEIRSWFVNFENQLKFIFDNNSLKLHFDRKAFNFFISINDRNSFDFNSMSEGYSAVLSIVTDLLLRYEQKNAINKVPGIVLIDEVETHLHIDLQKKILPFLTNLFPKIQFIVTTHSPFVLNSLANTVVYDVERDIRVEDLSSYSMDGIVETYFQQDMYSNEVKQKVEEFERLTFNKNRTTEENDRYMFLKRHFKELPKYYSPELTVKLQQIELASL